MAPLWALFIFITLSIAISPLAYYPIQYVRLLQLFTPIALFAILNNGISEKWRSVAIRGVLISFIIAGSIQSTFAICQYFNQKALGLRFLAEAPLNLSHEGTPVVVVKEGKRWIFDTYYPRNVEQTTILRAHGTMPHPNVLGGFLVIALLGTTFFMYESSKKRRWIFPPLYFLLLFALATTYCRSAIFAWLIGSALFFALNYKYSIRSNRFAKVVVFTSLSTVSLLFYEPYLERGGIFNYSSLAQSSDAIRILYQKASIKMVADHPFFGVGHRQFSLHSFPYLTPTGNEPRPISVHNVYLLLASESGLFALASFMAWIGLIFLSFKRANKTPLTIALFSLFISFLFIGVCDLYPIAFQQGLLMFFSVAGLLSCSMAKQKSFNEPSRQEIHKMFDEISGSYDRINRILSLGLDLQWRKAAAKYLPEKKGLHLLDLATGTADQLIALFEAKAPIHSAIGIDLSQEMILLGEKKVQSKSYGKQIELQIGDALTIPFEDQQFDACTFSFGIRNVKDPLFSLKEIHRILKPEGRCLVLEFSLPPFPIKPFYLFYLRRLLPWLGNKLSHHNSAYTYLNQTIETFPSGKDFLSLMEKGGFNKLKAHKMALGAVTLYVGEK